MTYNVFGRSFNLNQSLNVVTAVSVLVIVLLLTWYYWRKHSMEKREVQRLVEEIISEFLFACVCRGSCVRLTTDLIEEHIVAVIPKPRKCIFHSFEKSTKNIL